MDHRTVRLAVGALAAAVALAPSAAHTRDEVRRGSAMIQERGGYSIGVFHPVSLGIGRGLEVQTHPILFLVAPNVRLRVAHVRHATSWLTGEYGVSIPTFALRLTQGNLFPTWDYDGGQIGWMVVPRVGMVGTFAGFFTGAVDFAFGLPLGRNDARPTVTYAPLELLLAPALRGYRGHIGFLVDSWAHFSSRFVGRCYSDFYLQGGEREQAYSAENFTWTLDRTSIITRVGLGVDIGIGAFPFHKRLALGVAWYNSDQHAIGPATFTRKRSNDFYPTFDFIWQRW